MYRTIGLASLLAFALILDACGSSNAPLAGIDNINGNWTATLTNSDGSLAYQFSATFTQGSGSELSITNLTYTTNSCSALAIMHAAQGSFVVTGGSNGKVTGTFGMSEVLLNVGGPTLNLQGKTANGTISGVWTVTGLVPPCSGNGLFTIQPTTAR